jgi:hypothetical protein
VLESKLLSAERLDGAEHLVGICSRRHREHQLVGQAYRLGLRAPSDLSARACLLEV